MSCKEERRRWEIDAHLPGKLGLFTRYDRKRGVQQFVNKPLHGGCRAQRACESHTRQTPDNVRAPAFSVKGQHAVVS